MGRFDLKKLKERSKYKITIHVLNIFDLIFSVLTSLSAMSWWPVLVVEEAGENHGQATGKLYYFRLRVECTLFCNLQSRAQVHVILVIGLYELLANPTTKLCTCKYRNCH